MKKQTRKSIKYRMNHWINSITLNDIKRIISIISNYAFESLTVALMFLFIFIIPALFH